VDPNLQSALIVTLIGGTFGILAAIIGAAILAPTPIHKSLWFWFALALVILVIIFVSFLLFSGQHNTVSLNTPTVTIMPSMAPTQTGLPTDTPAFTPTLPPITPTLGLAEIRSTVVAEILTQDAATAETLTRNAAATLTAAPTVTLISKPTRRPPPPVTKTSTATMTSTDTPLPPQAAPLTLNVEVRCSFNCEASEGDYKVQIEAQVSGGVTPYTFDPGQSFEVTVSGCNDGAGTVSVTSTDGQTASGSWVYHKVSCQHS
jgi:hypothetical protein